MNDHLPPFHPLPHRPPATIAEQREDGSWIIRTRIAPAEVPSNLAELLRERASEIPDRKFLLEREPGHGEWRSITYGEARQKADAIAQWLIDQGLGPEDSVLVISGNSLEHAMLMLGCYTAGIPIAPVSAAYSLMSSDHAKLLYCFDKVKAKAVFAKEGTAHAAALSRMLEVQPDLRIITCEGGPDGATNFADILTTVPTEAVDQRVANISTETVGKYLFTSGSTGMPKCVPQTHGMMTAVIAGTEGLYARPRKEREPNVRLDWMPWSHISGGNLLFNTAIWEGSTIHLDDGRPVPGLFDITIKNLCEISPTSYGSAPIGLSMLADVMEQDETVRAALFKRITALSYGGATLSDDLYDRLQALAIAETGKRIPITTMYGATETQGITYVHWVVERVGLIGLPMPGSTLKLVPNGEKLEVRVKGPSVTSGYLDDPAKNAEAFDEEGFYSLGDAAKFVDPSDPDKGLVFDGRVTEDFKLSSGTWVSVGTLRPELVAACSPLVHDCVIAGQDKEFIGVLIWPSPHAVQKYTADKGEAGLADLASDIAARLADFNIQKAGGSSRRVGKFVLLTDPPSLDAGELTDKGYINQRAVLARRATEVDAIYSGETGPLIRDMRQMVS